VTQLYLTKLHCL